jgi:hypothetical protein
MTLRSSGSRIPPRLFTNRVRDYVRSFVLFTASMRRCKPRRAVESPIGERSMSSLLIAFKRRGCARVQLAPLVLAFVLSASPVLAERPVTTLATLLNRAQIEDMLVDYYDLFGGANRNYGSYYTADGVLDVNGIVRRGRGPIDDLYKSIPREKGRVHILLTNLRIAVNGDAATTDLVWTEMLSETHGATPHILEQGRDHDELVKQGGRWYFRYRVVTNDGGLPPSLEKGYKER